MGTHRCLAFLLAILLVAGIGAAATIRAAASGNEAAVASSAYSPVSSDAAVRDVAIDPAVTPSYGWLSSVLATDPVPSVSAGGVAAASASYAMATPAPVGPAATAAASIPSAPQTTDIAEPSSYRLDVPLLYQGYLYPTGCEIVSTAMLLDYLGYPYTVDELIDRYLPTGNLVTDLFGNQSGPSPYDAFVGDPRQADGFGCYEPVIENVLAAAVRAPQTAVDTSGKTLAELADRYVKNGTPVLVWVTIGMMDPSDGMAWQLDGTGETFTWIAQEHCMVLVGADDGSYWFNDPMSPSGPVAYDKSIAELRYEELGMQSVTVL
jgi:uncharacterized protein YvpB